MKKGAVVGCSIFSAVILIIVIACGGFLYFKGSQFMSNNAKIVEEMIGNKIPAGFMPAFAMDLKDNSGKTHQDGKFAMLIGQNSHIVILVEGPPIATEEDKKVFFEQIQKGMQQSGRSGAGQSFDIKPDGKVEINGKEVEKYKITMKSEGKDYNGIGLFFANTSHTILYFCFADVNVYNDNEAIEFAKAIKQ